MTIIASTLRSEPSGRAVDAARVRLDAGFETLVLAAPLYRQDWDTLKSMLPRESILAVELFLPLARGALPGRLPQGDTSPFSLGSLHREAKRDAEKYGPATLSFAHHQGARYVLLPSIALEGDELRPGAAKGPTASGGPGSVRPPEAEAHLDSYLSTLDRLLVVAERYEVTLAITPAGSNKRMPDADDTALCLSEFRGAPLCVWPDTAQQAQAALLDGEVAPQWRRFEPVPGVTLRDVSRDGSPCLPGDSLLRGGSVDWPKLIRELEEVPRWLVDPPPGAGPGEIVRTLELLRGYLEPEAPDPLFPGR